MDVLELLFVTLLLGVVRCQRNAVRNSTANHRISCDITAVSYAQATDWSGSPADGYVSVNGRRVWEAGWGSSKPNLRGINTMILNPVDCSVTNQRQFDTVKDDRFFNQAYELLAHLNYIRTGAVLIGVTGEHPMRYIGPAFHWLLGAGILVKDIRDATVGSFAFVIHIGYPENTVFSKPDRLYVRTVQLNATVTGSTRASLKITRR